MKRELGVWYCGLICGLCSSNTHCGGCKMGIVLEKRHVNVLFVVNKKDIVR